MLGTWLSAHSQSACTLHLFTSIAKFNANESLMAWWPCLAWGPSQWTQQLALIFSFSLFLAILPQNQPRKILGCGFNVQAQRQCHILFLKAASVRTDFSITLFLCFGYNTGSPWWHTCNFFRIESLDPNTCSFWLITRDPPIVWHWVTLALPHVALLFWRWSMRKVVWELRHALCANSFISVGELWESRKYTTWTTTKTARIKPICW